jgi:glycosyltransferase involved in cell wall biosynthesis
MNFTVVIPTFNGETRLPRVLDKLKDCIAYSQQVEWAAITWEIMIIDNNSCDRTAEVVQTYQTHWPINYPLKYVFEPQQGLGFARQRAIQEARGEFVGFLDDDNFPEPDWVIQAYLFGKERPNVGAYGGKVLPIYEATPPENFDRIEGFLAIRDRGDRINSYQPELLSLPPGAGMVVRRQAWCDVVPKTPRLRGKIEGKMIQGDDWEPLIYLYKAGWEIWYNPAMSIDHQIPAWRLEREYMLTLIHGSCLCFCPLRVWLASPWQKPIVLARMLLGNAVNALRYWWQYRQQIPADFVRTCELQIYLSRMASVGYFLKSIGAAIGTSR